MALDNSVAIPFKESDDSEDSEESDTPKKACDTKVIETNLCPFKLEWSIGINPEVPLTNLTTENRTIIAYACSHIAILYNYNTRETLPLQGHQNGIRTLSISRDGKWLLTADFEEDSVVVVWDTEHGVPICSLFNPHGEEEMTAARISPNAKYIVTVGNEKWQKVHFWLWTYGKDTPDASIELAETVSDRVKEINFNEEFSEQFMLTTDNSVLFFIWEYDGLRYCYPQIMGKVRHLGIFECSCYVRKTHLALTGTQNGFVLVWNSVSATDQDKIVNEQKRHVKSVRLQRNGITVILNHDGMIVTGNSMGRINFYDKQLRILYWCQNCGLDSIRSISFDLKSGLIAPASVDSESELECGEEDEFEGEVEYEEPGETGAENEAHEKKINDPASIDSKGDLKTIHSKLSINIEHTFRNHSKKRVSREEFTKPPHTPTDATLRSIPFSVGNFFVCTSRGVVARINISKLKCQFLLQYMGSSITSLDAHPYSNYVVVGNDQGVLYLYNYKKRKLVVCRSTPPLPDFKPILDDQVKNHNITYVTCPLSHEKINAVTVLKYSPKCDMLVCGLGNGMIWILHPTTLVPLDEIPYKHSTESILKLTFTDCAKYMAYYDNTLVVAVFKRNNSSPRTTNLWNFIGKYRSHYMTIRDIVFGSPSAGKTVPRLFSLGEDKDLVEYDLENSGPYPDPGLKILQIHRIEYTATPLCLTWYPKLGIETFLIVANSEYKYRLLNDMTKEIRGTFLGPLFGGPVKLIEVLHNKELKHNGYMVFATDKEIGLQIFPIDGNPYKVIAIVGHPRKVSQISLSYDDVFLFSSGYNDPCVLMWKIKYKSVDVMARLGGEGLSPFYCLIEGGRKGWLISEMQDLFYYAQILQQGENTMATRIVSDKIFTKQIPSLMRAVGFYPSNEELETILGEVAYRNYAETGQLVEEITFCDFVKLYVNHRPAFGLSMQQMKEAFQAFVPSKERQSVDETNPTLTRQEFLNILLGIGPEGLLEETNRLLGEPLTVQETYLYLKLLVAAEDSLDDVYAENTDKRSASIDFNFLPERISYKDFTADIMGIELPEETRADDE